MQQTIHDLDDLDSEKAVRRLFGELENVIRENNRQRIVAALGTVHRDAVVQLADGVARLRAHYLHEVIELARQLAEGESDADAMARTRCAREDYEELLHGFGALRHALRRGYMDVGG